MSPLRSSGPVGCGRLRSWRCDRPAWDLPDESCVAKAIARRKPDEEQKQSHRRRRVSGPVGVSAAGQRSGVAPFSTHNDFNNERADGPFPTAQRYEWFWDAYIADSAKRSEITASPNQALIAQLRGLPRRCCGRRGRRAA
jgi:hypothetical protein